MHEHTVLGPSFCVWLSPYLSLFAMVHGHGVMWDAHIGLSGPRAALHEVASVPDSSRAMVDLATSCIGSYAQKFLQACRS